MSEIKRIQGMVRSIDQWLNMVPSVVVTGSMAQVEYALADAKTDTEALWLKVTALSSAAVAGGEEVVAFLIERLVAPGYGPARSIVDAAKYDPTQDSFWVGDAKSRHLVTPLYPAPPTPELEGENARLRADLAAKDAASTQWRDALDSMHRRALEAEARLAEAMKALDAIIERSNNDPLGTSKVNDMRSIAEDAARRVREEGKVDG